MMTRAPFAGLFLLLATTLLMTAWPAPDAPAQAPEDSHVTTERFCSFMMAKGEAKQECEVPMQKGCKVAQFPGTTTPWTTISRGGKTTCHFDKARTDWRTRIIGVCGACTTEHCSASFHVKLDCAPS